MSDKDRETIDFIHAVTEYSGTIHVPRANGLEMQMTRHGPEPDCRIAVGSPGHALTVPTLNTHVAMQVSFLQSVLGRELSRVCMIRVAETYLWRCTYREEVL
ncbi:uncharacterized protein SPSK_06771 [Sporothrix schenckii 1099-18]|uniref:Uncharacterized protein n=1 Tax=Sporothrix schenckii 1099-18 TaxID=1397361 RepID=A0A0F2ML93_SPOSC|nr:uncharacterized protein SPSK_06771 [Sporothrix schenckii 1099-18]KJR89839.1 hypothetical protein SPSK_06771 [Sporothrix schenckii 1099-18]